MPRSPPDWLDQAAAMLAGGATKADVARQLNLRRETISRQFSKRLKAAVEQRVAAATATAPADLVARAHEVMAGGLDSEDKRVAFEAAKIVLARVEPPAPDPASAETEEASPEAAVRELVATLPTLPAVLREGVPPELVDQLRLALQAALDDLKPALAAAVN